MIIQGSDHPLVIEFDQDVSGCTELLVTLWAGSGSEPVARWRKSEMTVDGSTAICPLSESVTSGLKSISATVEVKGLDEDGTTIFWDEMKIPVKARRDRNIGLRK